MTKQARSIIESALAEAAPSPRTFSVGIYALVVRCYFPGDELDDAVSMAKRATEELLSMGLAPGAAHIGVNRAGSCVFFEISGGTTPGDRWEPDRRDGMSPGKFKAVETLKAAGFRESRTQE